MIMRAVPSGQKRIVVDVDTQRHFFLDNGRVCVHNHHQVLANIRRVMAWIRMEDVGMISTMQIYSAPKMYNDFLNTGNENQKKLTYTLRNRYTSLDATDSTDLPPAILERYNQVILMKRCFDPFAEPRADRVLSELEAEEFILIGAAAEGAVKATALGLLNRRKNVTVLVDAIGSYDKFAGEVAFRQLWERGARLIDIRTFLGYQRLLLSEACEHHRH